METTLCQYKIIYSGQLRQHATVRDKRGIPILYETEPSLQTPKISHFRRRYNNCRWINNNMLLSYAADELRDAERKYEFLCAWSDSYHAIYSLLDVSQVGYEVAKEERVYQELERLNHRIQILKGPSGLLPILQKNLPMSKTKSSSPKILLRAFHHDSFCVYDEILGILSSNYTACRPLKGFEELRDRGEISEAILKNHTRGPEPTSFISLTDDPDFLLNRFIEKCWPREQQTNHLTGKIAFVDVDKLRLLNIFHTTSLRLRELVGAKPYSARTNPNGLHYLTSSHWMAYGWIPSQCIEKVVSLDEFRAAFKRLQSTCSFPQKYLKPEDILAEVSRGPVDGLGELVDSFQRIL